MHLGLICEPPAWQSPSGWCVPETSPMHPTQQARARRRDIAMLVGMAALTGVSIFVGARAIERFA